jgi:tetratricopeptide (TPR) repeat protein
MPDPNKTVFISYRRSVSRFIARSIFMDLKANNFDVFMDVETIDSGEFDKIILSQIGARAHFVLVLATGSLERLNEEDDWLRREIETAMDMRRNIIPVMVDDFNFTGTETYLTGKLAELPRFNGLRLYFDYFEAAMDRLRNRYLKQPMDGRIVPTSEKEKAAAEHKIEQSVGFGGGTSQLLLNAEIYIARGLTKERRGNLDAAISDYTKAIAHDPDYPDVFFHRAKARLKLGDLEGAMADYTETVERNPHNSNAFVDRGEVHFAMGEADDALVDFRKANNLTPGDPPVLAALAVCNHVMEHTKEARRLWSLVTAVDPNYQDTAFLRQKLGWTDALITAAEGLMAGVKA